jgi:hypothetical protein
MEECSLMAAFETEIKQCSTAAQKCQRRQSKDEQ